MRKVMLSIINFILLFLIVGCISVPYSNIIVQSIDSITYEDRVYNKITKDDFNFIKNEIIGYIVKDESMINDDGITYIVNKELRVYIFGEEIENPYYTIYSVKDDNNYIYLDYNAEGLYDLYKLEDKYLIKDLGDIYKLDSNNMNFVPLYVVENNEGIIKYIWDGYYYSEGVNETFYSVVELNFLDGGMNLNKDDYKIITPNGFYDLNNLRYGDVIICHYDYKKSHIYALPPQLFVFDLFYLGENLNIDFEYNDLNS